MYTAFESLPDSARVWIYQADRKFTAEEKQQLNTYLQAFLESWSSHGRKLMASFLLPYDHFIVLAVAEEVAMASGCSIDKSVEAIRNIESQLGISLLNRNLVAFKVGENIQVLPIHTLSKAVADGSIQPGTPIFNNAVTTLLDFKNNWEVEAINSWMKRYFKSVQAS